MWSEDRRSSLRDAQSRERCSTRRTGGRGRLIKYARDEGAGIANCNPALHPRTGTPPNPGWFAPTGGAESSSRLRLAENRENSHRTGAATLLGDRVHLPEGHYIDELADFVEWWPTPDQ